VADEVAILHADQHLIVVDKPPGLIVHPSVLTDDDDDTLLDRLRAQLEREVWPVHRLDRPTSGAMVLALDAISAARLSRAFEAHEVGKTYLAVVRGWPQAAGEIDHPVKDRDRPDRPARPARTRYRRLATAQIDVEIEKYPCSRFALLELSPLTGRRHQLRRHLKHLHHPIIGDTTFGRGAYNRWCRTELGVSRLLLHACQLTFAHPATGLALQVSCPPSGDFDRVLAWFGWQAAAQQGLRRTP
jgi:tRNA pseudouridine65 synthase